MISNESPGKGVFVKIVIYLFIYLFYLFPVHATFGLLLVKLTGKFCQDLLNSTSKNLETTFLLRLKGVNLQMVPCVLINFLLEL